MKLQGTLTLLVVAVIFCARSQVVLNQGGDSVVIENEFIQLGFNKIFPKIDLLRADFTGLEFDTVKQLLFNLF